MFRTDDNDMAGIPGMLAPGLTLWHGISRVAKTHWYHVTARVVHDGSEKEMILSVDGEPRLQRLLVSQDNETHISSLQVVTPPWMNKRGDWHMESVNKVTIGEDKTGCSVCLIEVESGATYHTSHSPGFSSNLLTNLRPIFLSSMIRPA